MTSDRLARRMENGFGLEIIAFLLDLFLSKEIEPLQCISAQLLQVCRPYTYVCEVTTFQTFVFLSNFFGNMCKRLFENSAFARYLEK